MQTARTQLYKRTTDPLLQTRLQFDFPISTASRDIEFTEMVAAVFEISFHRGLIATAFSERSLQRNVKASNLFIRVSFIA